MPDLVTVAKIYTPFPSKFGVPRQSGLADVEGRIVFEPAFRSPDAVRGLEGFSHIWLIWSFSRAKRQGNALTVRPPRLGGNERVGVFASRSPFRPNGLGLSCVKLLRVDYGHPCAPVLYVSGADLIDGTPIFDIKPYLPFTDAVPDAVGGYAEVVAGERLKVRYACDTSQISYTVRSQLTSVLEGDPRPHYQNDPARVYAFEFSGLHVEFRCDGETLTVVSVIRA